MAGMSAEPLNRHIARGTVINYAGFFAGKLIVFVNMVVLARLLAPEHFGLVALGLLFLAVSEAVFDAGSAAAVVWRPGTVEETAPVALTLCLIGASGMALVLFLTAPALASLFEEPQAIEIIRVLAICTVLSAPSAVFAAILQRRMEWGKRLVPEVARAATKGAVGIPLAIMGLGAWSLVWGHIAGVTVGLALAWWLVAWRPRLSLERRAVRVILPYLLHIAAIGLLGIAIKRLDVAIIGIRFDAAALGYYTLAFALIELVVIGICWSASHAFFSALSRTSDDLGRLRQVFRNALAALLAVVVPVAVGLALIAEPLILTFYGAQWAEAVILMQILALYALVLAVAFNLGDVYKATGVPHVLTWISAVNLVLAVPILVAASQWGVWGVAAGQALVAGVIAAVNWAVARRLTGIGLGILFEAAKGPALAVIAMAAACLLVDRLLLPDSPPPLRLAGLVLTGGATYCAALWLVAPQLMRGMGALLPGRQPATAQAPARQEGVER